MVYKEASTWFVLKDTTQTPLTLNPGGDFVNKMQELISYIKKEKLSTVERLRALNATDVSFSPRTSIISFRFDNHMIRNHVMINKHEIYVGNWSRNNNVIKVDDDILRSRDKNVLISLALHESIEKYVSQRYSLRANTEAHIIAETVEYRWATAHHIDWARYDLLADMIRKKEDR
jgi:hypothetical protein